MLADEPALCRCDRITVLIFAAPGLLTLFKAGTMAALKTIISMVTCTATTST